MSNANSICGCESCVHLRTLSANPPEFHNKNCCELQSIFSLLKALRNHEVKKPKTLFNSLFLSLA